MSRYFNDLSDPNSLAHHGILGMKWGVQNGPPYPLAPGDHSAAEKKAGALGGSVGSRESNAKKKRAAAVKKAQATRARNKAAKEQEARDKAALEDIKKRNANNPKFVSENARLYSDDELNKIVNRYDTQKRLNEYNPSKIDTAKKKVEKAIAVVGTVALVYNTAASIRNAFSSDKKKWPTVQLPKKG